MVVGGEFGALTAARFYISMCGSRIEVRASSCCRWQEPHDARAVSDQADLGGDAAA